MGDEDGVSARYLDVFTDPLAWRLWAAATISYLGDFVGLGALLLVAYDRSGHRPLGPAAVFAVQALPALLVATAIGPWLDKIPRVRGLAWLCLIGAAALALPFLFPGLAPVLAAAAVLGGVRTAYNSIRSGAMADSMPRGIRGRLIALMNVSYSASEVVGYFSGSAIAIVIGAGPALAGDAATFLISALLLIGLRLPRPSGSRGRSSMTTGIRTILADPTLVVLAPVAWVGLTMGAVPAVLATAALRGSYRGWVPAAMAAMAAGLAIAGTIVGRTGLAERVGAQFRYIMACGAFFVLTGLGLHLTPLLIVAGNFAVGAGTGWTIAAQTTFLLVIAPERMAHVTSTMIASLIALEGAGATIFGAVANSLGVPTAYLMAGAVLLAAALTGMVYTWLRPQALDLGRDRLSVPAPR